MLQVHNITFLIKKTSLKTVATFLVVLLYSPISFSDVSSTMPDFYGEPGKNPFRQDISENFKENIDPFSGNINLSSTDIVVPGNGGMDIRVQRHYNSSNVFITRQGQYDLTGSGGGDPSVLQPRSPYGLGWSLHFGRVTRTRGINTTASICDQDLNDPLNETLDNPILELPDGTTQILFENDTNFDSATSAGAIWITKTNWVAYCRSPEPGLLVISPDGTKYTMDEEVGLAPPGGASSFETGARRAWYTSLIEDRNGNQIVIDYIRDGTGDPVHSELQALVSSVTGSNNRSVAFNYTNQTNLSDVRLASITSSGNTWKYIYSAVSGSASHYKLDRVEYPGVNGHDWQYSYYTNGVGDKLLKSVTYPLGAISTYGYAYECLQTADGAGCTTFTGLYNSPVVISKTNSGSDVAGGAWLYNYDQTITVDTTTVTFPGGSYVYIHGGSRGIRNGNNQVEKGLWKIGLLQEKQIFDGSTLVQREVYTWGNNYVISNETFVRPPFDGSGSNPKYTDTKVYVPVLLQKDIERDGTTYTTTYDAFDASFNPITTTESGTGQPTKTRTFTYFPRRPDQNIVSLVKNETIKIGTDSRQITRVFDNNSSSGSGNLTKLDRFGEVETYSYYTTTTGDLKTKKKTIDGSVRTWTYSSYYRGIPRTESHPEGVRITRTVDPEGTIKSEGYTGLNDTKSYVYDGMNRLTSINLPLRSDISISWPGNRRVVNRGTYQQTTTYDGFGRPSCIVAGSTGNFVYVDIDYDVLGNKSFESYPGATNNCSGSSPGTTYTYDVLGRIKTITHADGTSQDITYNATNSKRVVNENGDITVFNYRSFGNPDEQDLMNIAAPEGVTTVYARNTLGQVLTNKQGDLTRTYTYFTGSQLGAPYLKSIDNPETNVTTFGRDESGNMTSREVGASSATNYDYDGIGRLKKIIYPGTTPDVNLTYYDDDLVDTVNNGLSNWKYEYDRNRFLTRESLTVQGLGKTFVIGYTPDSLDFIDLMTYPSGRVIDFQPDTLGRPFQVRGTFNAQVSPYVNSVTYHPNGIPSNIQYNNSASSQTIGINNRHWINSISATGAAQSLVNLSYTQYDGRGNVGRINDTTNSTTYNLGYDKLDRLTSASGPWGAGSMSYDTSDNIRSISLGASSITHSYTNNQLSAISGAVNISGIAYDKYGNIEGYGNKNFFYDDASNLRTAVTGTATRIYDYDGNNRRVVKQSPPDGPKEYFVYNKAGHLVGQYNPGFNDKEYFYLGSRMVASSEVAPDTPPSPPVSITVPANSAGNHTISWGASPDSSSRYELFEATDPAFTTEVLVYTGLQLSNAIVGKLTGTYYYRVRACNVVNCGDVTTGANSIAVVTVPPVTSETSSCIDTIGGNGGNGGGWWWGPVYPSYTDCAVKFTRDQLGETFFRFVSVPSHISGDAGVDFTSTAWQSFDQFLTTGVAGGADDGEIDMQVYYSYQVNMEYYSIALSGLVETPRSLILTSPTFNSGGGKR